MRDFFTLISIENTKLWKRLSTKVMVGILILILLLATGIYKYHTVKTNTSNTIKVEDTWKENLQTQLNQEKATIKQLEASDDAQAKIQLGGLKKSVAEAQYRIDNNIKPNEQRTIWDIMSEFNLNSLIALFVIIAGASLVAGEFTEGTMKMMISRPYSRNQLLSAKFISTLIYGLELMAIGFVATFLLTGILFGFNGLGVKDMFWTTGKIIYMPAVLKMILIYLLDFLQILLFVVLTITLSAITRSRSIATGFSLFIILAGMQIIQMLAIYFSWGKYMPFAANDFSGLVNNGEHIVGMGMSFSLISSFIYGVIICAAGYFAFRKRDI